MANPYEHPYTIQVISSMALAFIPCVDTRNHIRTNADVIFYQSALTSNHQLPNKR